MSDCLIVITDPLWRIRTAADIQFSCRTMRAMFLAHTMFLGSSQISGEHGSSHNKSNISVRDKLVQPTSMVPNTLAAFLKHPQDWSEGQCLRRLQLGTRLDNVANIRAPKTDWTLVIGPFDSDAAEPHGKYAGARNVLDPDMKQEVKLASEKQRHGPGQSGMYCHCCSKHQSALLEALSREWHDG